MSGPDVVNDFEAWATISARLVDKGEDERQLILSELGVTEVWPHANESWARAVAGEILEMRLHRAQRYAEICARVFDRETELPLNLSDSVELSLETTHRMRAHAPAPPAMRVEASSFVESLSSGAAVKAPKRNQARTQTVDPRIVASVREELEKLPQPEEASPDSGHTNIIDLPEE